MTKPRISRPIVTPDQKPVETRPEEKGEPCRMRSMKVTIHPPIETSIPTYTRRKKEVRRVMREVMACRVVEADLGFLDRFCGVVDEAGVKIDLVRAKSDCFGIGRVPDSSTRLGRC